MSVTPDIVEDLNGADGFCPFCGRDPFHYVDNGVGMERVAVVCCDMGVGLIQYGDEQLIKELDLRRKAADTITRLRADLASAEVKAWNEAIEAAAKLVSIVPAAMIGSSETYPKAYKDACYHAAISIRSLRKEQS